MSITQVQRPTSTDIRPASPGSSSLQAPQGMTPSSGNRTMSAEVNYRELGAHVAQGQALGCCCPVVCALVLMCGEGGGSGSDCGAGSLSGGNNGTANRTNDPCLEFQDPKKHPYLYGSSALNGFAGGCAVTAFSASIKPLIFPAFGLYGAAGAVCLGSLGYKSFFPDSSSQNQTDIALAENSGTAAPKNNTIERGSSSDGVDRSAETQHKLLCSADV